MEAVEEKESGVDEGDVVGLYGGAVVGPSQFFHDVVYHVVSLDAAREPSEIGLVVVWEVGQGMAKLFLHVPAGN